jgi:hypothetical protein
LQSQAVRIPTIGKRRPPGAFPLSSPQPLILLGASVRAAAESAVRGGFSPWSLDQFADEDLRATGPAFPVSGDPLSWFEAFATAPQAPWMYTGGPENRPRALGKLAELRPLWGVAGRALRHVRDPLRLADALRQEGWPTLSVVPGDQPPTSGEWLRKPRRSGGGLGITPHSPGVSAASPPRPASRRHYFQHRLPPATPILGATFLMADRQARLLGIAEQFHGLDTAEPSPTRERRADARETHENNCHRELEFAYRGSISVQAAPAVRAALEQLGDLLARRFQLRGIVGVDVALHDGHCWVLEVNPRYPASAELFEDDDRLFAHVLQPFQSNNGDHTPSQGDTFATLPRDASSVSELAEAPRRRLARSLVALHAAVWSGQSPDEAIAAAGLAPNQLPLGVPGFTRGKWIVYARQLVVWPDVPNGADFDITLDGQRPRLNQWPQSETALLAQPAFLPQPCYCEARLADIPSAATPIPPARPLCTLLVSSQQPRQDEHMKETLMKLENQLLRSLEERRNS